MDESTKAFLKERLDLSTVRSPRCSKTHSPDPLTTLANV
jgi:hypothetical protein